MKINEAVKIACESGLYITTEEEAEIIKIKPTNGEGLCILMTADGKNPSKWGWQPTAKDLTREDWIVRD